jgi:hypothetical protein
VQSSEFIDFVVFGDVRNVGVAAASHPAHFVGVRKRADRRDVLGAGRNADFAAIPPSLLRRNKQELLAVKTPEEVELPTAKAKILCD